MAKELSGAKLLKICSDLMGKFDDDFSARDEKDRRLKEAEKIAKAVVSNPENCHNLDRKLDRILTSKAFGYPVMLLFLGLIFWITISGANYPSAMLSRSQAMQRSPRSPLPSRRCSASRLQR